LDSIRPNPFQPRKTFRDEDIAALMTSIKQSGVVQPILVRRVGKQFELIAGERRWRAAKLVGLHEIPAVVRQATDEQMLELALIENLHREDLNPIDRAAAYQQFCHRFGLRPDEVAERVGEDRSTVTNYLRLLELPAEVREMIGSGELSMAHARCLAGVADAGRVRELATAVLRRGLSVRALEGMLRGQKTAAARGGGKRIEAAHVRDLQRRFEETLKTKVIIQQRKRKGTGRIVIEYFSFDDFDRIAGLFGVAME
jgi:ParB family chromosome partitioning protein